MEIEKISKFSYLSRIIVHMTNEQRKLCHKMSWKSLGNVLEIKQKCHKCLHEKIFLISGGLIISLTHLQTIDTWAVTLQK